MAVMTANPNNRKWADIQTFGIRNIPTSNSLLLKKRIICETAKARSAKMIKPNGSLIFVSLLIDGPGMD
jgi:hypothetical protein